MSAPRPQETWLTPEDCADQIKAAAFTIRKWCRIGRIKGAKCFPPNIGWRIPPKAWEQFLKSREVHPAGESVA